MKHASHLFIMAFCITTSVFCNLENRTSEDVLKNAQEAVPVVIDWTVEKMHECPVIPGLITAAFLSKVKESFVGKRSSFLIWATLGTVVFAKPYHLFAKEYLVQRALQKKDGFSSELARAKESIKLAGQSVVLAAHKGSQEIKEKIAEKIEELTGNDSK